MAVPRVFISYSHDSEPHREAVLRLAQQLRAWGIDIRLDRFVQAPEEGWPRWMMNQVESADFVLIVCTAIYRRRFDGQEAAGKGKGATFESLLAIQLIYDANTRNTRFIPIVFEGTTEAHIPTVLQPYQRYALPLDLDANQGALEPLFRHIAGQPEIVAAPLGALKVLPPRGAAAPVATPTVLATAATAPPVGRSALPPTPVLSAGAADGRIEPIELLHGLLVSLFGTGDAFRQWVSFGPDGHALVAEFPGESASPSTVISGGLDVLRRGGYVDAEFFARLCARFSRQRDDIDRAAVAWGIPRTVPTQGVARSRSTVRAGDDRPHLPPGTPLVLSPLVAPGRSREFWPIDTPTSDGPHAEVVEDHGDILVIHMRPLAFGVRTTGADGFVQLITAGEAASEVLSLPAAQIKSFVPALRGPAYQLHLRLSLEYRQASGAWRLV